MKPLVSEWIQLPLNNSNVGQAHTWHNSNKWRKTFEQYLRCTGLVRKPFDFPVELVLTRIMGKRQQHWDADSKLRGNAKQLIDSLVVCGWFHDDSHKWIKEVLCYQDASQRDRGPSIQVEVFPARGCYERQNHEDSTSDLFTNGHSTR